MAFKNVHIVPSCHAQFSYLVCVKGSPNTWYPIILPQTSWLPSCCLIMKHVSTLLGHQKFALLCPCVSQWSETQMEPWDIVLAGLLLSSVYSFSTTFHMTKFSLWCYHIFSLFWGSPLVTLSTSRILIMRLDHLYPTWINFPAVYISLSCLKLLSCCTCVSLSWDPFK